MSVTSLKLLATYFPVYSVERLEDRYLVRNNRTGLIQSSWYKYTEANQVAKDLNGRI